MLREKTRGARAPGRENRTPSFASGVVILTISNLLVKVAGLFFKIPMNYIIGDTGMGYYHAAYSIYTLFYMLATAGLPVALSVLISEYRARGALAAARRVERMALLLFACIGLGTGCAMLFGADVLASLIRSEASAAAIAVAAPTLCLICLSASLRGYFQGCGNMAPTAISQLIEALGKLVIGMAAAAYAIRRSLPIHLVAAYAVSGLTLGSLAALVYLAVVRLWHGDRDLLLEDVAITYEKPPISALLARFAAIALPVTVSASVMSLTNTIDTAMIQRILAASMSTEEAATLYGNYTSLAVPMFNLPPVLVYPIAYALVPSVSASFAAGRRTEAADTIGTALRYAILIGLPCALGLTVLADPILCLLYQDASAHRASMLLTMLAPSSFFVCVLAVTNSALQACGAAHKPILSMLCGGIVKCVTAYILLRQYGMAGAPLSTFFCYLTVTVLNLSFVATTCGIRLPFGNGLCKPLIAALLCAATAHFLWRAGAPCILAIGGAALVYAVVLLFTGAVTIAELMTRTGLRRRFKRKEDSDAHIHRIPKRTTENRTKT